MTDSYTVCVLYLVGLKNPGLFFTTRVSVVLPRFDVMAYKR